MVPTSAARACAVCSGLDGGLGRFGCMTCVLPVVMTDVDAVVGTARGLGCDGGVGWWLLLPPLLLMARLRANCDDEDVVGVAVLGNDGDDGDRLLVGLVPWLDPWDARPGPGLPDSEDGGDAPDGWPGPGAAEEGPATVDMSLSVERVDVATGMQSPLFFTFRDAAVKFGVARAEGRGECC